MAPFYLEVLLSFLTIASWVILLYAGSLFLRRLWRKCKSWRSEDEKKNGA